MVQDWSLMSCVCKPALIELQKMGCRFITGANTEVYFQSRCVHSAPLHLHKRKCLCAMYMRQRASESESDAQVSIKVHLKTLSMQLELIHSNKAEFNEKRGLQVLFPKYLGFFFFAFNFC